MKGIFQPINMQVATSWAHINTTPKIPFHRHPYCVTFHFLSCSSLGTILIQGNSLGSTRPTQLLNTLKLYMDGNTP